jgi:hypothetical protein
VDRNLYSPLKPTPTPSSSTTVIIIATAAMLALVALLSLFAIPIATAFGDALGEVSRAMNALREADFALTNLQKYIGLLGASDARAKDSLDISLGIIEDRITACGDRFAETCRQLTASKWTTPKPGKPAEYWTTLKEEEQFRVIRIAIFRDRHGVTDVKDFHGRSKLRSGPGAKPNEISHRALKDLLFFRSFDTGFKGSASNPGDIFQLPSQIPINGTELWFSHSHARSQSAALHLKKQLCFVYREHARLADCTKRAF